jgi:hypothetical protein
MRGGCVVEQDGRWDAPFIYNPECEPYSGCGSWAPTHMPNPAYKGPWTPPLIRNPNYKGRYVPRKIENPNYFHDPNPVLNLPPAKAVGMELWTSDGAVHFDNLAIARSLEALRPMTDLFLQKAKAELDRHEERVRQSYYVRQKYIHEHGNLEQIAWFYVENLAVRALHNSERVLVGFVLFFALAVATVGSLAGRERAREKQRGWEAHLKRMRLLEEKKKKIVQETKKEEEQKQS